MEVRCCGGLDSWYMAPDACVRVIPIKAIGYTPIAVAFLQRYPFWRLLQLWGELFSSGSFSAVFHHPSVLQAIGARAVVLREGRARRTWAGTVLVRYSYEYDRWRSARLMVPSASCLACGLAAGATWTSPCTSASWLAGWRIWRCCCSA